jgi:surface-anchored protein
MNTRDGITDADKTSPLVGSHEHYNWGFSTNGIYKVTFQVSGQLTGSTNVSSLPTTFIFQVLPLPTNAPPAEIQMDAAHLAANGDFVFDLSGAAALAIEIQASDDLKQWAAIVTPAVTSSPQTITIPADNTKAHRFFRVQQK